MSYHLIIFYSLVIQEAGQEAMASSIQASSPVTSSLTKALPSEASKSNTSGQTSTHASHPRHSSLSISTITFSSSFCFILCSDKVTINNALFTEKLTCTANYYRSFTIQLQDTSPTCLTYSSADAISKNQPADQSKVFIVFSGIAQPGSHSGYNPGTMASNRWCNGNQNSHLCRCQNSVGFTNLRDKQVSFLRRYPVFFPQKIPLTF